MGLQNFRRYLTVACGIVVNIICGLRMTGGILEPYLASYFYDLDTDLNLSVISFTHTLCVSTNLVGVCKNSVGLSSVAKKYCSSRVLIALGVSMVASGLAVSPLITEPFWHVVVLASSIGVGTGFLSNGTLWACADHFPGHRGHVVGTLYVGFGFGPGIWSLVMLQLVNPHNVSPSVLITVGNKTERIFPAVVATQVPWGFQILSLVVFGVGMLCVLGSSEPVHVSPAQASYEGLWTAVRTKEFLAIFLSSTCAVIWWVNFFGVFRTYGLLGLSDDRLLNLITSLGTWSGVIGRFLWIFLLNKYGFRVTIISILGASMVLCMMMNWALSSAWLYGVTVALVFLVCHGTTPVTITAIGNVFGSQLGPSMYSVVSLYMPISGLSFSAFEKFVQAFGYVWLWPALCCILAAGIVAGLVFTEKRPDFQAIPLESVIADDELSEEDSS